MSELNERDWELVNAYHDGELEPAEAQRLEGRLASEPALSEALKSLREVSASLGALRPAPLPAPAPAPPAEAGNDNWRPARWLAGGAAAAALAFAVALGPDLVAKPSVFDIHADLVGQSFSVDNTDLRLTATETAPAAPDLASANLTPVSFRVIKGGSVTHYAGRNGCRLSYFRGAFPISDEDLAEGNQLATWTTGSDLRHMIVATGMDPAKFDAIAAYLKLVTRQQASEAIMASLSAATATAARCGGVG